MINPQWLELPCLLQISMAPKMFDLMLFDSIRLGFNNSIPKTKASASEGIAGLLLYLAEALKDKFIKHCL